MLMRINESWGYNLPLAIDDLRARRRRQVRADLGDLVALDEEVCTLERDGFVVFGEGDDSSVLEEDGCGCHDYGVGLRALGMMLYVPR